MADEDTPTTEEVRNVYCRDWGSDLGTANKTWYEMAGRRFDRWLDNLVALERAKGAKEELSIIMRRITGLTL